MSKILAILLLVAGAACWWLHDKSDRLQANNLELTTALESSERKYELEAEEAEAAREALETLGEVHAEAVAERKRWQQAFDGFSERLVNDPDIESRIERGSCKALLRVTEATGGEVDESICD